MTKRIHITDHMTTGRKAWRGVWFALFASLLMLTLPACQREPVLYLHQEGGDINLKLPLVELELEVFWDYELNFGAEYDWKKEWYYGWTDSIDGPVFGQLGYPEPKAFQVRRYHTENNPHAAHSKVSQHYIQGNTFSHSFDFGYWDILAWNDIQTIDGIQSLVFDESNLDSVFAMTNQSMRSARYQAPKYTRAFYQPEPLYAGYDQDEYISPDYEGFIFDEERNVWVKIRHLTLLPVTYIYLTQVILHHNRERVSSIDGTANLSGMARSVNLNTGVAGRDAITVNYVCNLKKGCHMEGDTVDIVGGKVLTFGMCNINGSRVNAPSETKNHSTYTRNNELHVNDGHHHYIELEMQFYNGMDSTFVFDVTDQVRKRYKGGVLTVELDMDTVNIPSRSGGSGFDAVVKDYENGGTHEFEL